MHQIHGVLKFSTTAKIFPWQNKMVVVWYVEFKKNIKGTLRVLLHRVKKLGTKNFRYFFWKKSKTPIGLTTRLPLGILCPRIQSAWSNSSPFPKYSKKNSDPKYLKNFFEKSCFRFFLVFPNLSSRRMVTAIHTAVKFDLLEIIFGLEIKLQAGKYQIFLLPSL